MVRHVKTAQGKMGVRAGAVHVVLGRKLEDLCSHSNFVWPLMAQDRGRGRRNSWRNGREATASKAWAAIAGCGNPFPHLHLRFTE